MRKIKLADGTVLEIAKDAKLPPNAVEVTEASELQDTISKAVEEAVAPLKAALKTKATGNMDGAPVGGTAGTQPDAPGTGTSFHVGKEVADGSGINLVRYVKAKATAALTGRQAVDVAKSWGYASVAKALSQADFSAGGSLVHQQYAAEFVELLRNRAVVRMAGVRQIPMPGGNLTWDRQAGAATAYYGNEGSAITPSEPSTEAFSLSEKKLTALVPINNDLIRNASIGAEQFVRDDMLNVMALREDLAFLRGVGSALEPRGIRNRIAAAHVYAETVAIEGSPTLAEVKRELNKAVLMLEEANVPMVHPAWLMAPRTKKAIRELVGPGGAGDNELQREMDDSHTLLGYPYFTTNQIPKNLGGDGDESELYIIDASEVIIGDSMNLELEVFPNATYSNNGTIVSGVSNDLTVVRAISKHDINMRHTVAGVCVTEISWGR